MSCVDGVCKIGDCAKCGEYAGNKVRCEGVRSKDGNCFLWNWERKRQL
jgi:hypothetical protein